jgi:hypothetical protein
VATDAPPIQSPITSNSDEKEASPNATPQIDATGVGVSEPTDIGKESEQGKSVGAVNPSGESTDDDNAADEWADDDASRKRRNAKAARWRQLPNPSDEQIAWLKEYGERKGKPGRKPKVEPPAAASPSEPPPKVESATIPRSIAKVKAPPPVFHASNTWREKYNGGVDNGRELLCRMLGEKWHKYLTSMAATLKDAGIEPAIDVENEMMRNLLVCAVDDILPNHLKATPAIVAAFDTTVITTQRVMKRKEIAEAQERKKRPLQLVQNNAPSAPASIPIPQKDKTEAVSNAEGPGVNSSGFYIR